MKTTRVPGPPPARHEGHARVDALVVDVLDDALPDEEASRAATEALGFDGGEEVTLVVGGVVVEGHVGDVTRDRDARGRQDSLLPSKLLRRIHFEDPDGASGDVR